MKAVLPVLYYVHDPMCSWCWGFRPVWSRVQQALSGKVSIQYVLGGLAVDTDQVMPESMQHTICETWKNIQHEIPGTEFNYDFWSQCTPRRSTYPACRAVIACRMQQPESEHDMLLAIQQAYYLQAKNPSDLEVLKALADKIGLDTLQFIEDINSESCQSSLLEEIIFSRELGVYSFPSLVLDAHPGQDESLGTININYNDSKEIVEQIIQQI